MTLKARSFSFTTAADGTGSKTVGVGAAYGEVKEIVIDDSANTAGSVVYTLTDARSLAVFVSDALDVSEGPFVKHPKADSSDDSDDNEGYTGDVIVKSPVVISCTSGGNTQVHTGTVIVEV